ncbi:MAG: DedA family protein [Candidatus Kerfeldbacteria bacterium]|nr:DedA family protein [Candidatus Kerfeldbacteria bacterium]
MDRALELLVTYSYLILFLGVVLEGEIFPLAAGFLVSLSLMSLPLTLLVTFVGAMIGDILWFGAARRWGRQLVDKWGHWLMLKPERLKWLENHFASNGKKTLFVTKFIYSFGHSSIIVAGLARMKFKEFIKVEALAGLIWSLLFVLLGKILGHSFSLLKLVIHDLAYIGLVIILLVIGLQILLGKKIVKS